MILTSFWTEALVVGGVIAFFLLISFLNMKTKAPKDAKLPPECEFCPAKTCIIKTSEINKKKEKLREYLNNCDGNDNETG